MPMIAVNDENSLMDLDALRGQKSRQSSLFCAPSTSLTGPDAIASCSSSSSTSGSVTFSPPFIISNTSTTPPLDPANKNHPLLLSRSIGGSQDLKAGPDPRPRTPPFFIYFDNTHTVTPAESEEPSSPASSASVASNNNNNNNSNIRNNTCAGCGYDIRDQFVLKVMDERWHESCLRCFACQQPLSAAASCFAKDGHVYCREDHSLLFGRKCGRCSLPLSSSDLVFRCMQLIFHAHCFSCVCCGVKFKMGDEFVLAEGEPVCAVDYHHMLCQSVHLQGLFDLDGCDSNRKTPKRPRTILNANQRRQFKAAFEKSAKPCRKVREQLAKETGLSVRVVQVWFQNQRAKMKKQQRKEQTTTSGTSEASGSAEGKRDNAKSDSEDDMLDSSSEDGGSSGRGGSGSSRPPPSLAPSSSDALALSGRLPLPPQGHHHTHGHVDVTPIDKLYNMHNTYFSLV